MPGRLTFLVELEIQESPGHGAALALMQDHALRRKQCFALAPQVLLELVHVVTDPRRFERPLSMPQALERALFWWQAREVRQVLPDAGAVALFQRWMAQHQLGRKRQLDAFLAATYVSAGVTSIVTTNARDYHVFEGLQVTTPEA